MIDGAHHARELTSISMSVYTMMRLLFGVVHNDYETVSILHQTSIFILPIVNYDGFNEISSIYD